MTKARMKICMSGALILVLILFVVLLFMSCGSSEETDADNKTSNAQQTQSKKIEEYKIDGVPVLKQEYPLNAGCETYACTMLLQSRGIDMDQFEFAENYLVEQPVYGDGGDNWYGPDMDSAYAGEIQWGYGVNSPAMSKFMNNMLKDKESKMKAQALQGVELETLCEQYIVNDIPVMIWATTSMHEPYVKRTWSINYVDSEVSDAQIGDTEQWLQNEHCLVLIGFDKENYYFADSVAGEVSVFEKDLVKKRYEQLGMQAIVVK